MLLTGLLPKCKGALVLEIIKGKTTVAEASRAYYRATSEVEAWVDDGKWGMENALSAKPRTIRCDNGPEYISGVMAQWAKKHGIEIGSI